MRKRPPRADQVEHPVAEQAYYEPPWFKVYDHIQNHFAYRISFQAWAIYTTLRMRVGRNPSQPNYQRCTVSHERMAIMWGVTTRTVRRAIRELRNLGLIRVKKNQASSTYQILKIRDPKKSRQDKSVLSDGPKLSLQRGHKRPVYQDVLYQDVFDRKGGVDTPSKGTQRQPGKKQPPPKFSQSDFDERDYRKWRKEMQALQETGASVGSRGSYRPDDPDELKEWEAEKDREWIANARTAAAHAGILPRRIVEILKQVYPDDPNVPKIAKAPKGTR
jgi:hypothetical protein